MSNEIVVTTVLSIIFSVLAAYIAIALILPMVRAFVKEVIGEPIAVAGFMSILVIFVYILFFKMVIGILSTMPSTGTEKSIWSYLSILDPGIKILDSFLPYVNWLLLGALIAFGFRKYVKK